jgi:hypothetical protein
MTRAQDGALCEAKVAVARHLSEGPMSEARY